MEMSFYPGIIIPKFGDRPKNRNKESVRHRGNRMWRVKIELMARNPVASRRFSLNVIFEQAALPGVGGNMGRIYKFD